jgi:hypothetical protein
MQNSYFVGECKNAKEQRQFQSKTKAEITNTLTYQMMRRIPTLPTVSKGSIHFEFDIRRTVHRDIFL